MGMSNDRAVETARELTGIKSMLENGEAIRWNQFRSCNAYVSQCLKNRFFLIKSYQTIVGIVDDQEADFFEIGKYSRTTSKQVTQIHNAMFPDTKRHYVEGRV
jgi:hypothetical protein